MTDVTDLLNLGLDAVDGVLPGVTDWTAASPCDGWTVRDVLAHVTGTLGKAHAILTGSDAYGALPADPSQIPGTPSETVARWHEVARGVRDALPKADLERIVETRRGPESVGRALFFPASDLPCHAWDLAAGSGQPLDLPQPLLDAIRTQVESIPAEALRRPGLFGPEVEAPEGASETDQLMAWLGRRRP